MVFNFYVWVFDKLNKFTTKGCNMITKKNFKRVIVKDNIGVYEKISPVLPLYKKDYEVMELSEFLEKLPTMEDTIVLCYGRETFDGLKKLHDEKKIHIGLRNFNYSSFSSLPQVYIGTNKIIFGVAYMLAEDTKIDDKDTDAKLDFFFSNAVFKEPLPLPETHVVGLEEGCRILEEVFMPDDRSWIGFDFETSGFPWEPNFKITGFALSKNDVAYYFDFRKDYEYKKDRETVLDLGNYRKFTELFRQYLKKNSRNLWAYNCAFEMYVIRRWLNELYYIQDAMALCVADDKKGSLKFNTQYYLKCPSWNDELSIEQAYIETIKQKYKTFKEFKDDLYLFNDLRDPELVSDKKLPLLKDAMCFYTNDLLGELDTKYPSSFFLNMLEDYWDDNTPWYACNPEKLGIYCCYDAFYGMKLAEKLFPAYGNNCYMSFLFNRYIGMELQMGGIHVDMDKAHKLQKFCRNICDNFEIFLNKLYLRYYWRVNEETYKDINIPDKLKDILLRYPECCISKPSEMARALVSRIAKGDILKEWLTEKEPPLNLLNDALDMDVSDEFFALLGNTKGMETPELAYSKKAFYSAVESTIKNFTNIEGFIKSFNRKAIEVLKDRIDLAKKKAKSFWFSKTIRIEDAWIFFDVISAWVKKYGKVLQVEGKKSPTLLKDKIDKAIDKARAEGYFVYSTYTEDDLKEFFNVPDNVRDLIYDLRDVYDEKYLSRDLTDWLPKYITQGFDGINGIEISAYKYLKNKITDIELKTFKDDNYYSDDPFVNTPYFGNSSGYEEKICNYWSNDQFPEVMGPIFEKFLKKESVTMNLCWKFLKSKELTDDSNAVRTNLNLYRQHEDELVNSSEGREVFILEDPITHEREYIPWKLDFLSNLGSCAEMYYRHIFDDPKGDLTTELPTDNYKLLAKLGVFIDLASVARKELTTYVKAIINCNHKVFMKDANGNPTNVGYFTKGFDDFRCTKEELGELDTYVPHFSINNLATKRCSSAYNTFLHESNAMECLVVLPGRIKSYFDRLIR